MTMTDPITRLNAALEGRYHVEREIGEGGMATVYLAEDLRHERKEGSSKTESPSQPNSGKTLPETFTHLLTQPRINYLWIQ